MNSQVTDTIVVLNKYPKDKYNVLIPVTSMQIMSNMQRIVVNEVCLDTDVNKGDIYLEKSSNKYAITKVGGTKLAAAANVSVVSSESVQPDVCIKCISMTKATGRATPCGACPHAFDVKYIVTVRVPEPSGGFRLISKDKEIDCSLEKETMKPDQYKRFLPHRASIAETKAFMRCVRDALGLKAGYSIDELRKPFIIAHIVPNLDAPEIRDALANSYLQSMGLLFESPATQKQLTANTDAAPVKPEAPIAPEGEVYDERDYQGDAEDESLPWDEPGNGIYCQDCGEEIVETSARGGGTWKPDAIKGYSEKRFGRCLCPACQQAATSASKGGSR